MNSLCVCVCIQMDVWCTQMCVHRCRGQMSTQVRCQVGWLAGEGQVSGACFPSTRVASMTYHTRSFLTSSRDWIYILIVAARTLLTAVSQHSSSFLRSRRLYFTCYTPRAVCWAIQTASWILASTVRLGLSPPLQTLPRHLTCQNPTHPSSSPSCHSPLKPSSILVPRAELCSGSGICYMVLFYHRANTWVFLFLISIDALEVKGHWLAAVKQGVLDWSSGRDY